MPNTTNFNWPTPADTDLVKDGAAAIRNLGNGVDTSLVDLKGGTTGQILSKASNADMDFAFITPNVGDLTEVQAGVGISVASGTGPIPIITNSSTDLITTAGDLLYGTAADTVARLGIGTAGQVLQVNSGATAPEWAAPAGGVTFAGCYLKATVNQSISHNSYTTINWTAENYDTDAYHNNSTNNERITIPAGKAGYYYFHCMITFDSTNTTGARAIAPTLNGTGIGAMFSAPSPTVAQSVNYSVVRYMDVGDYMFMSAYQASSGSLNIIQDGISSFFLAAYLGA
jgi:hypothetical protein